MHNYSITNSKVRITIISFIAIISAYITFWFNPVIKNLPWQLKPLSPFFIFGLLYFCFDSWLWKIHPISKLVQIPNFNGTWSGEGETTSDKSGKYSIKLNIKQTFSRIVVDASFNNSHSESIAGNVDFKNPHRRKLTYLYQNDPDETTVKTMSSHIGTVELCLKDNNRKLSGNYFTNREPKQTKGKWSLEKEK